MVKLGCLLASLVLLAAWEGCGRGKPPLGTVHGRVTVKGKPVEQGSVRFESVVRGAQPDGRTGARRRLRGTDLRGPRHGPR